MVQIVKTGFVEERVDRSWGPQAIGATGVHIRCSIRGRGLMMGKRRNRWIGHAFSIQGSAATTSRSPAMREQTKVRNASRQEIDTAVEET